MSLGPPVPPRSASTPKYRIPPVPNDRNRRGYLRDWERLVLRISTNFIRLDAPFLDTAIDDALMRLGELTGTDRSYVFLLDDLPETMTNTHEWCAKSIEPQKDRLQGIPSEIFPSWMDQLRNFETINCPKVCELPEEAADLKAILEAQSVQSVVAVPMAEGDRLIGFVGFDSVRAPREWRREEIHLLKMSANIISSALVRRRTDAELRSAQEQLLHTTKMEALGRFVGGTAHDFNNLLTVILGNCDSQPGQESPKELERRIEVIRDAAEKAAVLTRSLLAFGRRQIPDLKIVDVNELIRGTDSFLDRILGERIEVRLELDPDVGCVSVDPAQIQQVLMNISANARDAMPDGGTLLFRTKRCDPQFSPDWICIDVQDDGAGMDEVTLTRAVEPFYTTKEVEGGTGLGLSSVHGIVSQFGGVLSLRSRVGEGTTVRIELPQVDACPERSRRSAQPNPRAHKRLQGKLLIVEDDRAVLEVIRVSLEKTGLEVVTVDRAEKAEPLLADPGGFDILVTDLVMPGAGGASLVESVRAANAELPIVVISGYSDDIPALHPYRNDRTRFLTKPLTPRQLLAVIEELLTLDRRSPA